VLNGLDWRVHCGTITSGMWCAIPLIIGWCRCPPRLYFPNPSLDSLPPSKHSACVKNGRLCSVPVVKIGTIRKFEPASWDVLLSVSMDTSDKWDPSRQVGTARKNEVRRRNRTSASSTKYCSDRSGTTYIQWITTNDIVGKFKMLEASLCAFKTEKNAKQQAIQYKTLSMPNNQISSDFYQLMLIFFCLANQSSHTSWAYNFKSCWKYQPARCSLGIDNAMVWPSSLLLLLLSLMLMSALLPRLLVMFPEVERQDSGKWAATSPSEKGNWASGSHSACWCGGNAKKK